MITLLLPSNLITLPILSVSDVVISSGKGMAPIVMVKVQKRTPEILPVSDYNDQLRQVSLQNPANLSKHRLSYKDFEIYWSNGSQNKCVLITLQQLTERGIRNVSGEYLSAEAFEQISVRSR